MLRMPPVECKYMEMLSPVASKATQTFWLSLPLTELSRAPASYYRAEGMIKNVNTIEDYRNMDKSQMIIQAGKTVRRKCSSPVG